MDLRAYPRRPLVEGVLDGPRPHAQGLTAPGIRPFAIAASNASEEGKAFPAECHAVNRVMRSGADIGGIGANPEQFQGLWPQSAIAAGPATSLRSGRSLRVSDDRCRPSEPCENDISNDVRPDKASRRPHCS